MLPKLDNHNAFIEITNPTHGGNGWEIGKRLWSPVYSVGQKKTWRIMEEINIGDTILHLVDSKDGYVLTGISLASSRVQQTDISPPSPGKWGGMAPYQYVELAYYACFDRLELVSTFFSEFEVELKQNINDGSSDEFYVKYVKSQNLGIAQKYLARCSNNLYKIISLFINSLGITVGFDGTVPTKNEPNSEDQIPARIPTMVSRIIRDTDLSRSIKSENKWKCQICGLSIPLSNGNLYSEGHHIKPLGIKHNGPDVEDNIIVLCPNHHAEFDFGSIAIHPETNIIHHIDDSNPFNNKELSYVRSNLRKSFLEYHYHIFQNNKEQMHITSS